MSMPSVYDTPPDGDFARYVETLGHESAARLLQQGAAAPTAGQRRTSARAAQSAHSAHSAQPVPSAQTPVTGARALPPLRKMLKLGFVLWLGYTLVSSLFPRLAVMGWPLLIFFAVAAFARLRTLPWADLAQAARSEAEQKLRRPSRPK